MKQKIHYRTVWLSDIHLGCKDCKAEYLLDFLNNSTIDTLFLVGDIVDLWALSKKFLWPASITQHFTSQTSLIAGYR
ncbi:Ser/Thr protein phosphatase family protein, UDP-2,3-diacylglucosamine hydrolase [gamma proteobacterium IMCC1989]|nr:Ser/Thr protein phosphatase family protein, UDP-2,3-diacylglucosamine hydrolase [gamma proteobacterium IMCC1989]